MLPKSLDPDALQAMGAATLVGVVIVAGLVLWTVQRMVMRVILLGLLIGIGVFVWYERDSLKDCGPPDCTCKVLNWDVHTPGCPDPVKS